MNQQHHEGGNGHGDERVTFSVDEVARRIGMSRSAVYEAIARGEIPAKRFGRRVVVVRAVLEALLLEPDPPRHSSEQRWHRPARGVGG